MRSFFIFLFNGFESNFTRRRVRRFFGNNGVESDLFNGGCDYVNVTRFILRPDFHKMIACGDSENIKSFPANQTDKIDGLLRLQLSFEKFIFTDGVLKNVIGTFFGFRKRRPLNSSGETSKFLFK